MVRLRSLFVAIVLVIGASSCEKIIKGMIPEPMISMKIDGKNVQKGENDNYYFKSELHTSFAPQHEAQLLLLLL